MSAPRLRIAVVGTGFGARIQVPGFRASGRFEVVALVGRDPARTREAAARLSVPHALTDLAAALALDGLDAVSIATPPAEHAAQAIAVARAGKHVLCEKPMARSLEEATAMAAAARAAGIVARIGHEFRFHPARATLQRIVARGDLGEPRLLACLDTSPLYVAPYRPPPAWWFDASAGGGWLGASGSHLIDGARTWLGEPTCLTALVDRLGREGDADDSFSLLLRFASGARATLQQSAAVLGPRAQLFRLAGTEATAWIDEHWTLWRAGRDGAPERVATPPDLALPAVEIPEGSGPFAATELPSFVRQAIDLADAIEGGPADPDHVDAPPRGLAPQAATFRDGLACLEITDAARLAADRRQWVDLPGAGSGSGSSSGPGSLGRAPAAHRHGAP